MAEYEVWLTRTTKERGRTYVQADSPEEAQRKVEEAIQNWEDRIKWGYEPEDVENPTIVEAIEVSPC